MFTFSNLCLYGEGSGLGMSLDGQLIAALKEFKDLSTIKALLNQGAGVNVNHGDSPLHIAAHNGNTAILKILLDKGAGLESQGISAYTPLHTAVNSGKLYAVLFLLQQGANVNAKDASSKTPLENALLAYLNIAQATTGSGKTERANREVNQNRKEIIKILMEHGGKIKQETWENLEPKIQESLGTYIHEYLKIASIDNS